MTPIPTPAPATHRERQKAQTRVLILRTARDLFEAEGFEKTTMRRIAAKAGIGYGTIFKHFENKLDLLAACLHEAIEATLEQALASLPVSADLRGQFMHLASALIRDYGHRPQLSRTLIEHMIQVDGTWKTALDDQVNRFLQTLETLIRSARDRGEIRGEMDSGLLALSFFTTYLSTLAMSLRGAHFDAEQAIDTLDRLIEMHLTGALAPREPS